MRNLVQFYIMANDLLNAIGLPVESFAAEQDTVSINVEERFAIHFCMDRSGSCFFLGDRLQPDGKSTASFHREWLMANQIRCGALQPVVALNGDGELSCWVRLPTGICPLPELLSAFDVLVAKMDELTHPAAATHGRRKRRR